MRNYQIGVMGSAADLKYSKVLEKAAERLGELIARSNGILLFGAEKDYDSLATAAARGAKSQGGLVVGITYGKGKNIWQKDVDIIIPTGLERGGGREMVLVLACDAIISLGGGSGTLTELAISYQAGIPAVVLSGYGGWSDRLADQFLDDRKRLKFVKASTPEEAVELAFRLAAKDDKNGD